MFYSVDPAQVQNIFDLIGREWMLITAGSENHFNTMTASWGTMGVLWRKKVAMVFVRPNRYTYQFMEQQEGYTLSFFDEAHRSILDYCGSHSGKNVDKIAETGLTPVVTQNGNVYFDQAKLVFECKKMYVDDIKPDHFLTPDIPEIIYNGQDYHRLYVGEVIDCLIKEPGK
ncbi:MAG: flavin reductase family protein [Bacteroidota bacterium]